MDENTPRPRTEQDKIDYHRARLAGGIEDKPEGYDQRREADLARIYPTRTPDRIVGGVNLTARELTELLRGLAQQVWTWDHVGLRKDHPRRAANATAWKKLIDAGGVAPVPDWYRSGIPEFDARRELLAAREAEDQS
jgi:hypothetical protein